MKAHKPSERALKAVTHFRRELSGSLTISSEVFAAKLAESLRFFADEDEYAIYAGSAADSMNDENLILAGGSPAARQIARSGDSLEGWEDRLTGDKMLHDNRNAGLLVDKRWRSWILLPLPVRKQPWLAIIIARKAGRFADSELEAARHLREYLAAALRDIRSRNRKASRLAQEERHRALLRTQSSLERDAGDLEDFGRNIDWSAGTGSDASLIYRSGDTPVLGAVCDVTADDQERQSGLVYLDTWFAILYQTSLDAKGMLRRLNGDMVKRKAECYASVALFRLDAKNRRADIAGCGSVTVFHFRHGELKTTVHTFGAAAGISAESEITAFTAAVETGDILCACTDGLTEARKKSGDFVGADAVADIITRHYFLSAKDLSAKILASVAETAHGSTNSDDRTLHVHKIG